MLFSYEFKQTGPQFLMARSGKTKQKQNKKQNKNNKTNLCFIYNMILGISGFKVVVCLDMFSNPSIYC